MSANLPVSRQSPVCCTFSNSTLLKNNFYNQARGLIIRFSPDPVIKELHLFVCMEPMIAAVHNGEIRMMRLRKRILLPCRSGSVTLAHPIMSVISFSISTMGEMKTVSCISFPLSTATDGRVGALECSFPVRIIGIPASGISCRSSARLSDTLHHRTVHSS